MLKNPQKTRPANQHTDKAVPIMERPFSWLDRGEDRRRQPVFELERG
ncbi:MAG: hypothetical protein ACI87E_003443, partial [Mariniblastus sp.]